MNPGSARVNSSPLKGVRIHAKDHIKTWVRPSRVNSNDSFFFQKSTQIFRNLDYFLLKQINIFKAVYIKASSNY